MLEIDWPTLPTRVKALVTTRQGGVSQAPYTHFNLASHVGDADHAVERNRAALIKILGRPVQWLTQVHGCEIISPAHVDASAPQADGLITTQANFACAVLTADCLPVLMCDNAGREVAAVHAGWRGLAHGILSKAVGRFHCSAGELTVYLGPAISQTHFEVGEDVLAGFKSAELERPFAEPVERAFLADSNANKYRADLYRLARSELEGLGVDTIFGGEHCTLAEPDLFYSYRRESITGRFASLIWLE